MNLISTIATLCLEQQMRQVLVRPHAHMVSGDPLKKTIDFLLRTDECWAARMSEVWFSPQNALLLKNMAARCQYI